MGGIDQYTKLLLHGEGSENSTVITDSSLVGHSITAVGNARIKAGHSVIANGNAKVRNGYLVTASGNVKICNGHPIVAGGNAQIDTAQYKFEPSSILFDGSGDYLSIPDSDDWNFGTNIFTIDFWFRTPATLPGSGIYPTFFSQYVDSTHHIYSMYYTSGGGVYRFALSWFGVGIYSDSVSLSANTWYHLAFVKSAVDSFKIYLNGTCIHTSTTEYTPANVSAVLKLGGYYHSGADLAGYIDEFRISKGIARWETDFTPSTEPYVTDQYTKLLLHGEGSDGSTTFGDSGRLGRDGFSQSFYFDGSGDYLNVPSSSDFVFGTGDFTIEAWVYSEPATGGGSNYDKVIFGGFLSAPDMIFFLTNDTLKPALWDGTLQVTSSDSVPPNIWTHVAWSRTSGVLKIFINGAEVYSGVHTVNFSGAAIHTIGGTSGNLRYLTGSIDEVRISKGIGRFTGAFTPPTEPYVTDSYTVLLLHGDGNENINTFIDSSNFGRLAFNQSVIFDGSGDYLSIPDSDDWNFGTGDFTVECWYRPAIVTGVNDWDGLVCHRYLYNNNHGWSLGVNSGNAGFFWNWTTNGSTQTGVLFGSTLTVGQWYHVCVSRSGDVLFCAINGTVVEKVGIAGAYYNCTASLAIGLLDSGGSGWLNGYIDEVRISKGIARYTSNFTPPTEPYETDEYTVLLLHCDGSENSTVFPDLSYFGRPTFGSSIYFDGSGDYLSIPDSDDWNFGTNIFTIDFWFRTPATLPGSGIYPTFFSQYISSSNQLLGFYYYASAGMYKLNIYFNAVGMSSGGAGFPLSPETWYHFAYVGESSTSIKFYVNGVFVGESTTEYTPANVSAVLKLGGYYYSGADLAGHIDEFRISKGIARWIENFEVPTRPYDLGYEVDFSDIAGLSVSSDAMEMKGVMSDSVHLFSYAEVQTMKDEIQEFSKFFSEISATQERQVGFTDRAGLSGLINAMSMMGKTIEIVGLSSPVSATQERQVGFSDPVKFLGSTSAIKEVQAGFSDFSKFYSQVDAGGEYLRGLLDIAKFRGLFECFNLSELLRLYGKSLRRYYCILTGAEDGTTDLLIPIKTLQARLRQSDPTYLSVTIPSMELASDIADRPNGQLVIDMTVVYEGLEVLREEIVRVDLEDIRTDEGIHSSTITLSGHRTTTYLNQLTKLTKVKYRALQANGVLNFQCMEPDFYLRPGDTCMYNADFFKVGMIYYIISPTEQSMFVTESEES